MTIKKKSKMYHLIGSPPPHQWLIDFQGFHAKGVELMIVYLSILRIHAMVPKRDEKFFLEALVTKIIRNIIEFKIIFLYFSGH